MHVYGLPLSSSVLRMEELRLKQLCMLRLQRTRNFQLAAAHSALPACSHGSSAPCLGACDSTRRLQQPGSFQRGPMNARLTLPSRCLCRDKRAVNCPTFGRASPLPKDSSFSFNVCPPGKVIAGSVVRTGGIWDGVRLTCNSPLSAGVTGGTDIIVGGTGGMDQTQITTTTGFIKARLTTAVFSGTGTTSKPLRCSTNQRLFQSCPARSCCEALKKKDLLLPPHWHKQLCAGQLCAAASQIYLFQM